MSIIYIISQLVSSILFVLGKCIIENRLIPTSQRNPNIEPLLKRAQLVLGIVHQSLLYAHLGVLAGEDRVEFVADEEAEDDFYGD